MGLRKFISTEAIPGVLLLIAGSLALLANNSSLAPIYEGLLGIPMMVKIGALEINKPLLLWINDGLMAIFFLQVGLDVKKELLEGSLSSPAKVILPGIGAAGGVICPALIYLYFNADNAQASQGWAIPTATDIAFALGILSLLGDKVPTSLKALLMTIAILDDLLAIIIIAVFYSHDLSLLSLYSASIAIIALFLLNYFGVKSMAPYFIVGILLWVFVLKSGVHATLAGVVIAFTIPLKTDDEPEERPAIKLSHDLFPWVAFFILPLFAFANAGISLKNVSIYEITENIPLSITLGLFLGKQLGVFGFSWLAIKCRLAKLPEEINWSHLYGMSILCGIGFTMSLLIGSLAFPPGVSEYALKDRLGVLLGSLLSALYGYLYLRLILKKNS